MLDRCDDAAGYLVFRNPRQDVCRHLVVRRRAEHDLLRSFETQQLHQRAHHASPRVAAECDALAADRAEPAPHRVDIDQRLGRMLVPAVAGVDDRRHGCGSHAGGRAILVVAHDDRIAQTRDDGGAILQRFRDAGVRARRRRHIFHADCMRSEGHRRRFEAQPRSRAGLKEQQRYGFSAQALSGNGPRFKFVGGMTKLVHIVGVECRGAQQMLETARARSLYDVAARLPDELVRRRK